MGAINPLKAAPASPKELLSLPLPGEQNHRHGAARQTHFPDPFPSPSAPGEWSCSRSLGDDSPKQSCLSERHRFQAGKFPPQRPRALELTPQAGETASLLRLGSLFWETA